jgi:flagellar biosynthetic protein FliR
LIEAWIIYAGLSLARVASFVATLPLFGGHRLPRFVKIGIALALTAVCFDRWQNQMTHVMQLAESMHWLSLGLAAAKECIFGATLGFAFGLFLVPARIAGSFIGQEAGLTLASISDPSLGEPQNVFSHLFESLGILIFFALDMHHYVLATLYATLGRWPVGGPLPKPSPRAVIQGVSNAQQWGLLVIAPMGICLFVTTMTLALLAKAAPQMNLFSVGLAVRLGVALGVVLLFMPDLCWMIQRVFAQTSGYIEGWLQY